MGFCPQCGAAAQPGARFCAECGTSFQVPTPPLRPAPLPGAPLPEGPPPAGPVPAAAPVAAARKDTGLAEALILIGAVLGVLLPLLAALFLLFFAGLFGTIPFFGFFPGAILAFAAVVVLVLALAWGFLAYHARNLVRDGQPEKGGMIAVATGFLMLLFGTPLFVLPGLAGLLVLAGGILAWSAK